MSAWYVFSALGPVSATPGSADLLLGAPLFPKAVVDRPGRTDIVITAPDADGTHEYVDAVRLDGRGLTRAWTDAGLTLRAAGWTSGSPPKPNTEWATDPGQLPK